MTEIKPIGEQGVREIVRDFQKNYYSSIDLEHMVKKLSTNAVVKGAFYDGELAGYIAYYRNDSQTCTAYITMLAVLPQYRRMGLATMMLKEAINDCKAHGFRILRLEVAVQNDTALQTYRKLGFQFEKEASTTSSYYRYEIEY